MNEQTREYMKRYREKNQDKIRVQRAEYQRGYYLKNRKRILEKNKAWERAHPEKRRLWARQSRGVVNPTGERKFGCCDICQLEKQLNLDHDHQSGISRGWLCQRCNLKLGHWEIILREGLDLKFQKYLANQAKSS